MPAPKAMIKLDKMTTEKFCNLAAGSKLGRYPPAKVAQLHQGRCISAIHALDTGAAIPA
jgi:hypothetical protein